MPSLFNNETLEWLDRAEQPFVTSPASAEKSRAAPPIANANTEAVPRMSFLTITISRFT